MMDVDGSATAPHPEPPIACRRHRARGIAGPAGSRRGRLTAARRAAIAARVNRLFGLLIGVAMLVAMSMGIAAHAAERTCAPAAGTVACAGHADGDADQTRDADGAAHHHGGCHGHHVAAPVDAGSTAPVPHGRGDTIEVAATLVARAPPGAMLRPPIA